MKMGNMELDWFVREEVESQMLENLPGIAKELVEADVDYVNDFDVICEYFDRSWPFWKEFTAEEFTYVLENLATQCSLVSMAQKGLLEEVEDGEYMLTDLGKLAKAKLDD